MSSTRALRTLRGVVAATVSTLIALFSHVVGGGPIPGLLGIAVPLVLSVLVCVGLAGRGLSLIRVTISVAVSQVLFHTLFVLGSSEGPGPAPTHAHHGTVIEVSGAMAHSGMAGSSMSIAHMVAAVVTIALLHRGEAMLIRIAATTGHLVTRLVRLPPLPAAAPRPALRSSFELRDVLPLAVGVFPQAAPRRGPPVQRVS
ncbi:hypothetical protein [Rathayibacter tritici]|uniref:hypothetical protein n=1 Tax=Rathayibacter tritici TaxID=33888 RepID=UPI00082E2939|nr:hypothetical protein [Rathayibacter tritici]PPF31753.1 hypothetical protein C5C06_00650 [Rathayibacter tritici]PPI13044.1 hypothetical protein C5D07_11030 [Rathayibacter tritici]